MTMWLLPFIRWTLKQLLTSHILGWVGKATSRGLGQNHRSSRKPVFNIFQTPVFI